MSAGGRHSVCLALPDNSQQVVSRERRSAPPRQRPVPPTAPRVPQPESPRRAPAASFSGEYDGERGGLRGEAEEDEDDLSPDKVSGKRADPLTVPPLFYAGLPSRVSGHERGNLARLHPCVLSCSPTHRLAFPTAGPYVLARSFVGSGFRV